MSVYPILNRSGKRRPADVTSMCGVGCSTAETIATLLTFSFAGARTSHLTFAIQETELPLLHLSQLNHHNCLVTV